MIICKVLGSMWASVQHSSFDRWRLVVAVPWDALSETASGNSMIAIDTVGCGPGDIVTLVYEGSSAREILQDPECPAEAVIVGIVDRIDWNPEDLDSR